VTDDVDLLSKIEILNGATHSRQGRGLGKKHMEIGIGIIGKLKVKLRRRGQEIRLT
jgi:hypothetical protein